MPEERPLDKLLADLPGLVGLSRAKFDLARQVVRRRVNHLADIDRDQLRILANEVASNSAEDVALRIRNILREACRRLRLPSLPPGSTSASLLNR